MGTPPSARLVSLQSSLLTQCLACASQGWSLPLLGMEVSYERKQEDPGEHRQVGCGNTAARRSLRVQSGEDRVGVVGG